MGIDNQPASCYDRAQPEDTEMRTSRAELERQVKWNRIFTGIFGAIVFFKIGYLIGTHL